MTDDHTAPHGQRDLAPCPFCMDTECASIDHAWRSSNGAKYYYVSFCIGRTEDYDTPGEAAAAWNQCAPTQEEGEPERDWPNGGIPTYADTGTASNIAYMPPNGAESYDARGDVPFAPGIEVRGFVPTPPSAEVEALVSILRRIGGRRSWCGRCESFDHECGCTPNVSERRVTEELAALRTKGDTP